MAQVLILGGQGRIGQCVAADLLNHTEVELVLTGRRVLGSLPELQSEIQSGRVRQLELDLADHETLSSQIAKSQLVVHCAGPFRYRDTQVLEYCVQHRVNYLDVSDDRLFTQKAMRLRSSAQAAGVTAIVNSGVFPGISNSMVRLGVEQLEQPEQIHLSYGVAGSGGAGLTVMRTTFLGLQHPFEAWLDGRWRQVKPYTAREIVEFPAPYGRSAVYWFDMPETFTLAEAFPVQSVVTKFGSFPDLYNHLTWLTAHGLPTQVMGRPNTIEFLAKVSYGMTAVSDRFTGIGVAIQAKVSGRKQGQLACHVSSLIHPNTAIAAGFGTGSIAQALLAGELHNPGVWSVEQAVPTELFLRTLRNRGVEIQQKIEFSAKSSSLR